MVDFVPLWPHLLWSHLTVARVTLSTRSLFLFLIGKVSHGFACVAINPILLTMTQSAVHDRAQWFQTSACIIVTWKAFENTLHSSPLCFSQAPVAVAEVYDFIACPVPQWPSSSCIPAMALRGVGIGSGGEDTQILQKFMVLSRLFLSNRYRVNLWH